MNLSPKLEKLKQDIEKKDKFLTGIALTALVINVLEEHSPYFSPKQFAEWGKVVQELKQEQAKYSEEYADSISNQMVLEWIKDKLEGIKIQ